MPLRDEPGQRLASVLTIERRTSSATMLTTARCIMMLRMSTAGFHSTSPSLMT